jgi:hypothetical protein
MLLQDSGIAPEVVQERGYRSLTAREAAQVLPGLGFSAPVWRLGTGLLFPLTLPDDPAPLYQFRPDHPRRDDEGKDIKYEIPHKRPQRLIVHPRSLAAFQDATTTLYITEGAKKNDSLVSRGATALAGIGVWSFTVKRSAAEKKRGAPKILLPDWQQVQLQDRRVVICFDSDAAFNTDVEQAEHDLAALLRAKGARVFRVRLPAAPDGSKQGIDDFFARGASLTDVEARVEPMPRPRFDTISAEELYNKQLPPARWVIPGKLPCGATLFYGRGKDGKSLLAWNVAMATAEGGKALGVYDVEQGDVLYLALEDGERRGQERLMDQMLHAGMEEPPTRLTLVFWTAPRIGEGFMERLETWVDEHPEGRLIIVDILEKVRPLRTPNGSMYGEDYRALEDLQQFGQRHNVAILIIHHSNKSRPEDFRDAANGSNGLTGACDTLWSLHRVAGEPDAILKMTGRDIDSGTQELALRFADGFWTALGDADDYRLSKESQEVIDALTQATRPLTPTQLATRLGRKAATVRLRLKRMLARGEVLNDGEGYRPRSTPSSPFPLSPPPFPIESQTMESEVEKKNDATPETEETPATGVTSVTLGQNGPSMLVQDSDEALQRYRGVTGGGVTPLASITPEKDCGYSNGVASVTGVTPFCTHAPFPSDLPVTPALSEGCMEKEVSGEFVTHEKIMSYGTHNGTARPPQPCPGCQRQTTWIVRSGVYVCCYCPTEIPHATEGEQP